jgi:uncharacterized protein YdhG (YjbR/CyaY superfamily)
MKRSKAKPETIDEYIAVFPGEIRTRLKQLRAAIRQAAPRARERISYRIPTFSLCGNIVHFAGYERHIGFYPGSSGVKKFAKELSIYESAKGSVQFPHEWPLPLALIRKIVQFRLEENLAKYANRGPGNQPKTTRRTKKKARAT